MRLLLLVFFSAACGEKAPPEPVGPSWGWIAGLHGACWVPEVFDNPTGGDLAGARRETVDQLALQWRGGRNDGVDFGAGLTAELHTLLREKPDQVDAVAAVNLEFCVEWAADGLSTLAWGGWVQGLSIELTAGDCVALLEEPFFGLLAVDRSWQHEVPLCPGERVEVTATAGARYRLGPGGPVSTVAGLVGEAGPAGVPCREEGCAWGTLVGRFETQDGQVTLFPVGSRTLFTAPGEGLLSFAVNDDVLRDNAYNVSDGVVDGVSLAVRSVR